MRTTAEVNETLDEKLYEQGYSKELLAQVKTPAQEEEIQRRNQVKVQCNFDANIWSEVGKFGFFKNVKVGGREFALSNDTRSEGFNKFVMSS